MILLVVTRHPHHSADLGSGTFLLLLVACHVVLDEIFFAGHIWQLCFNFFQLKLRKLLIVPFIVSTLPGGCVHRTGQKLPHD